MAELEEKVEEDIKEEETEELGSENKEEEVVEEKTEEKEEPIDPDKITIETRTGEDEPVDYGKEIDPEDVKTIGTIVDKQTAGLKKTLQETKDRQEVDSFISEKPEFLKYKSTILKYVQHSAYNKVPISKIASMVAGDDLIAIGAKKEREAQKKADDTKGGGSPVRKSQSTVTDWTKASKAEVEAQKLRILQREI